MAAVATIKILTGTQLLAEFTMKMPGNYRSLTDYHGFSPEQLFAEHVLDMERQINRGLFRCHADVAVSGDAQVGTATLRTTDGTTKI